MRYLLLIIIIVVAFPLCAQEIGSLKNCEIDSINGMVVHSLVEIQPEYEGGMQKFYRDISSKVLVKSMDETGCIKVILSFVIDVDGNIQNVCFTEGVEITQEIIELINNWTAGKNKGKNVPVRMYLPMYIKLG